MSFDPAKQATLEEALAQAKLNPSSADNWNRAAIASIQLNDLEKAVEYIGHAIAIEPQDALNYSNRGRVLFGLGRLQEALADYSQAIELAPSAELYSSRSVVNVALGKEAAALFDLNDAIDLAPTAENYLNRAAFFANKSITGDALRDISKVIELKPDDPNHRLTRANLAFAAGQNELGISDVEEAIRLDQSGVVQHSLLQLADQLEAHLSTSPQPEVSRRLIKLIREKSQQ
jgi:tetratricopeptide (TPR) repeat protein